MKKIILILTMLIFSLSFALADTCTETDDGYEIYLSGTTTSDNGSAGMPAGNYTDKCSSSIFLVEYACPTNSSTVVDAYRVACPSEYICTSGACVEDVLVECVDSSTCVDGFSCDVETGSCYNACNSDSQCADEFECNTIGVCVEEVLVEICDNDGLDDDEDGYVDCDDSDCSSDFVCASITTTGCSETDSGYDIYVKGTTTSDVGSAGMPAGSYNDTCSSRKLKEYSCPTNSSEVVDYSLVSCPTGYICKTGACFKLGTTLPKAAAGLEEESFWTRIWSFLFKN